MVGADESPVSRPRDVVMLLLSATGKPGAMSIAKGNIRGGRHPCNEGCYPKRFKAFQAVAERKLAQLNAAVTLEFLPSPPRNPLEKLTRDRAGQYSIRINDQQRVCFCWQGVGGGNGGLSLRGNRHESLLMYPNEAARTMGYQTIPTVRRLPRAAAARSSCFNVGLLVACSRRCAEGHEVCRARANSARVRPCSSRA